MQCNLMISRNNSGWKQIHSGLLLAFYATSKLLTVFELSVCNIAKQVEISAAVIPLMFLPRSHYW